MAKILVSPINEGKYKFMAAIKYNDGSITNLCRCITENAAIEVCKGWMKRAKKSIVADILLRD